MTSFLPRCLAALSAVVLTSATTAGPLAHLRASLLNSDGYRQAQAAVNAAEREVAVSQARRMPQARLALSGRLDKPAAGAGGNAPRRIAHSATATQLLFDKASSGTVAAAEAALEVARHQATAVQQQVLLGTYRAYLAATRAQANIALLERRQAVLLDELDGAQADFAAGRGSQLDIIIVEARLASLRADTITARAGLAAAIRQLHHASGLDDDDISALVRPPDSPATTPAQWLARAGNAPAALIAAGRVRVQEALIEQGRGATLPSVSLVGSTDLDSTHSAQVQLSMPLTSSGAATHALERLEIQRDSAAAGHAEAVAAAELAVRDALADMRHQATRGKALTESVDIATRRLGLAQAALALNAAVRTDVLNAETDLAAAELALVQANHAQLEAWLALLAATGELSLQRLRDTQALFD